MEDDPRINLTHNGEHIPFGRDNVALYKFFGEWATHDHVFILIEAEDEADDEGLYVFKTHELYPDLAKFIVQNNFIMHLNLPEPSPSDKRIWEAANLKDLGDYPPEWEDEAA